VVVVVVVVVVVMMMMMMMMMIIIIIIIYQFFSVTPVAGSQSPFAIVADLLCRQMLNSSTS
jgi:hypothetical protein